MAYLKERTTSTITIYRPQTDGSDTEVQTVLITEDSKRVFSLMSEDYIELHFTLAEAVPFEVGDWINDEIFGDFVITEKQMPSYDTTTGGYVYSLKFERPYRKWKNRMFMLTAKLTDGTRVRKEANWSLTAALALHAEEIQNNLVVIGDTTGDGMEYSYIVEDTATRADEVKNISYAAISILEALTAIADAYECEWWVTYDEKNDDIIGTIHFGKCEDSNGTDNVFELAKNVEDMTIQDDNSTYCNRLYAFGATTNIPSSYRKTLTFKVTERQDVAKKQPGASRPVSVPFFRDANHAITKDMLAGSVTGNIGFGNTKELQHGNTSIKLGFESNAEISACGGTVSFTGAFNIQTSLINQTVGKNVDLKVSVSVVVCNASTYKQVGTLYSVSETFAADFSKATSVLYAHNVDFEEAEVTLKKGTYIVVTYVEFTRPDTTYSIDFSSCKIIQSGTSDITECIMVEDKGVNKATSITYNGKDYPVVWEEYEDSNGVTQLGFYFSSDFTLMLSGNKRPSEFGVDSEYTISFTDLLINKVPLSWFASDYDNPSALTQIGDNRLMLPVETGSYLQPESGLTRDQIVELAVSFDNIFPRCVLKITEITTEEKRQEEEYEDGSKTYWDWTQYKFTAKNLNGDTFRFNKSFIKSGETLQIKFLTEKERSDAWEELGKNAKDLPAHDGYKLAGMTFDVNFKNISQLYTIVRNEDYGAMFPNNTLKPEVGDPFILVGWDVRAMESLGLIEEAEKRLQAAAEDYLDAIKEDQFAFTCKMMSEYGQIGVPLYTNTDQQFYEKSPLPFYVKSDEKYYELLREGARVTIKHAALTNDKTSRVIGYEFKLDKPYDSPQYTIGETEAYSRIKLMEKEITKLGGS